MNEPLLLLRHCAIERNGRSVLTLDRLTLRRGELLAVVGPNGAGKSSLLLALAQLLPYRGQMVWNGRDVRDTPPLTHRRRIGMVLQAPLLFDRTVFDNVASGLRFRGVGRAEVERRVSEWLDRLGVLALRERRATELSGGEAQRVSLARALVLEPELLLLDEPFVALDPPTRHRLRAEFAALLQTLETTTLLVTHDLNEAVQLGQRLAIILDGALRRVGTPDAILNEPRDTAVAAFLRYSRLDEGHEL